jgi:glycosyltransferase involved in cell wall biosynthesis
LKKNKIHILYVIDGFLPGGKERQFIEILKGLDRNLFKVGIVTFNKNQFYSEKAKELSDYFVELDKDKNKFKPFLSIWKCFREFKPQIVHTWDYLSSLYVYFPSLFKGVKFINGSIRDSGTEKGWQNKAKNAMLKRADLVVANSLAGLKSYGVKNGVVIYNAVNQSRFLENENSPDFNIIKVANFSDYKDHISFTKAAIKLVADGIVDTVYYAGDGKHRKTCEEIIRNEANGNLNKFQFLGAISNVEEYLRKCKVGVLCSTVKYSEGVSNSVLEYMAADLVPVATDIGASSEIITNNENGFLVDPNNIVSDLKDKIELIKKNSELKEKLIKGAKQTITEKFNYKGNLNKLTQVYLNIVTKKS